MFGFYKGLQMILIGGSLDHVNSNRIPNLIPNRIVLAAVQVTERQEWASDIKRYQ